MQKVPYHKQLQAIIDGIDPASPPSLLLHACCAPCSSSVLERLASHFRITVFYYNPNISTLAEYEKREAELKRLISLIPRKYPISFVSVGWEHETFLEMVKGYEEEPEGGARCHRCYEMRLRRTARLAKRLKYDYFTTTLSLSPLKNAQKINEIGEKLSAEFAVHHLPSDFKKEDGYKRSVELSREYDLYRQDYCGCIYSIRTPKTQD